MNGNTDINSGIGAATAKRNYDFNKKSKKRAVDYAKKRLKSNKLRTYSIAKCPKLPIKNKITIITMSISETLMEIRNKRLNFIRSYGKIPTTISMSQKQLKKLSDEIKQVAIDEYYQEQINRLQPNLLPKFEEPPKIVAGGSIFGMYIIESTSNEIEISTNTI